MLKHEWMTKVKEHANILHEFVNRYHPRNLTPHSKKDTMSDKITAPQAEKACEIIRDQIRKESLDYPDVQFDIALQKEDGDTIASLLSSAWFGVPENTDCWRIPGFAIAVDLLDDPIEEPWDDSSLA